MRIGKTQIRAECECFNELNLIHRVENGVSQQENIASFLKKTKKKPFNEVHNPKDNNLSM
jgi:hypothetical protein